MAGGYANRESPITRPGATRRLRRKLWTACGAPLRPPFSENSDHAKIHPALAGLIDRYQPQSTNNYQNAVREIAQEIALLGLWRTPHQVRVYDLPSLFAGKLHAVLCRNWKSCVKGRDFYDLVFGMSPAACR